MTCQLAKGVCNNYGSHAHLRPGKNDKDVRKDRGSMYPDALCGKLVLMANQLMGAVRMQPLNPAFTTDGHADACMACANAVKGGAVYSCDGCSDVYHYRCIPKGTRKPY